MFGIGLSYDKARYDTCNRINQQEGKEKQVFTCTSTYNAWCQENRKTMQLIQCKLKV